MPQLETALQDLTQLLTQFGRETKDRYNKLQTQSIISMLPARAASAYQVAIRKPSARWSQMTRRLSISRRAKPAAASAFYWTATPCMSRRQPSATPVWA